MATPSTSPLVVDLEEDHLVLELLDSLTYSTIENLSLSDDVISSDVSFSVIPPPQTLTEADASDLVDGRVFVRVQAYNRGGSFGQQMVDFGVSSRNLIGDYINSYGDADEDDYDLDDELVPRSVSKKLKRDRIRKSGKRGSAKVRNFKRSPYSHLKPGCIHGKHGFGIRFRD